MNSQSFPPVVATWHFLWLCEQPDYMEATPAFVGSFCPPQQAKDSGAGPGWMR